MRIILKKNIVGMAVYPFIFLRDKQFLSDKRLINHEKIHLRQQLELLIIPFYLWYFGEYLYRLWQYKNQNLAYKNISFEREAYDNDVNLTYLDNRKWYAFLTYL